MTIADARRAPHLTPAPGSRAQATFAAIRSLGGALAPWLDLATRVALAQGFLAATAVSLMSHAAPAMAGGGAWVAGLNGLVASWFGTLVAVVCPLLLVIGLCTRPVALPLLVQALLLHSPGTSPELTLFWSALLLWLVVMGPGTLSLDALLARGLDSSAVPGARALAATYGWVTRRVGPWTWLALRLWTAGGPLALGLAAAAERDGISPGTPAWVAVVPRRVPCCPKRSASSSACS